MPWGHREPTWKNKMYIYNNLSQPNISEELTDITMMHALVFFMFVINFSTRTLALIVNIIGASF